MKSTLSMTGRSLLTLHDLSDDEMVGLIGRAQALKANPW